MTNNAVNAPTLRDTIAALEAYAARDPDSPDPWVSVGGGEISSPGGEHRSKIMTMPYSIYDPQVDTMWAAFRAAGYQPRTDYLDWSQSRDMAALTPAVISTMSRDDLMAFVTWCERGEHFCDGHWVGLLRDGSFLAIASRLATLCADQGNDTCARRLGGKRGTEREAQHPETVQERLPGL